MMMMMMMMMMVMMFLYRQFPKEGISSVKALLLTHDHADATFGMDDLRDLQKREVGR